MQRKEIIRNLLIILLVCVLTMIPWASVIGIQDPSILNAAGIFQRSLGFVLITAMVLHLVYQIYGKPLAQEMKEEEIREAEQKAGKSLLFKPTFGFSVMFMFFLFLSVLAILFQFRDQNVDFLVIFFIIGFMILWIWLWYQVPVFIFTEDSVHIKSHLVYLIGIDRKTIFRYVEITSVNPDVDAEGRLNSVGLDSRYRIAISMKKTVRVYSLSGYNPDTIAKIYLRFKEKLGDKVRLE